MLPKKIAGKIYYGWVIVLISFSTLLVVFGIRLSFSVFFVALIEAFGWSRADTALIFSLSMLTFALTSTHAGMALDTWGARRVFGAGVLLLGAGLLFSGFINHLWQLAVAYGILASLGVSILGLGPQGSLISRWFQKKRGLAIGLTFAGTGIGALLLIPGVTWIIGQWDWRMAYWCLAALAFLGFPFNVLLLRLSPTQVGAHPDGMSRQVEENKAGAAGRRWTFRQAVRTRPFWLVMGAAFLAIGPVRMLTVHQMAAILDAGYPQGMAATVIGFGGVVTALSFISIGALSDRVGREKAYAFGAASLLGAVFLLDSLDATRPAGFVWGYAVLFGIGEGSRSSLLAAAASDLFPGEAVGAVSGAVGAMFGLGAAIFPWLAGWIFDQYGSYSAAFWLAGLGIVLSAFFLGMSRRPDRSSVAAL